MGSYNVRNEMCYDIHIYKPIANRFYMYEYCMCTYFSGIHILAELAPNQVR